MARSTTWQSNPRSARLAIALAAAVLTGCVPANPSGQTAARSMSVAGGAAVIVGPAGYCIDRAGSRQTADGAFILVGNCAALEGRGGASRTPPAVLTAAFRRGPSPDFAENLPAMAEFFASRRGRAALSRTGNPDTVSVQQAFSAGDVLYLRATDRAAASGAGLDPEYWRAILPLGDGIATLTVLGLASQPASSAEKRRLLDAFVARLRAANR